MNLTFTPPAVLTSRAVVLPAVAIAIACAAAVLTLGTARNAADSFRKASSATAPLVNVEFVAAPQQPDLRDALEAACAATGCDAPLIGSLVLSAAIGMTETDLRSALRAQVVQLERLQAEIEGVAGSDAASPLRLQWTAEAQIADLYRAELDRRAALN
ncbi:hypothetical protein [Jannaschia sp. 2305UL9-9]|uniref:hypothetical protein n=1 Tax=Jannaschia sp. 2305UL9-9 TaxID=3121638 RepID=UPI003526EB26